jgi:hypothetical protein
VDRVHGFCCGATIALTVLACGSSGPGSAGESSTLSGQQTPTSLNTGLVTRRATSPVLPEDSAAERPAACDPYAGSEMAHLSALVGHALVDRRGGSADAHDACSLFGDGIRVRFVTLASSVTEDSARLSCHLRAGAGAQFVAGLDDSMSWQSPAGVYTAQEGQCLWTQVYRGGSVDPVASLAVARDLARRF